MNVLYSLFRLFGAYTRIGLLAFAFTIGGSLEAILLNLTRDEIAEQFDNAIIEGDLCTIEIEGVDGVWVLRFHNDRVVESILTSKDGGPLDRRVFMPFASIDNTTYVGPLFFGSKDLVFRVGDEESGEYYLVVSEGYEFISIMGAEWYMRKREMEVGDLAATLTLDELKLAQKIIGERIGLLEEAGAKAEELESKE